MTPIASAEEIRFAKKSIYAWWYEFLKLSPDYPPKAGYTGAIAKMYKDFKDLGNSFEDWWQKTGRRLFSEPLGSSVEVLWDSGGGPYDTIERMLIVAVSMRVPRKDMLKDFDIVLEEKHPGKALETAELRYAKRQLYERKRYDLKSFPKLKQVHEKAYRQRYVGWKRIAAEVGVAQRSSLSESKNDTTRRLFERAERIVDNAVHGHFPTDEERADVIYRTNANVGRRTEK